MKNKSIERLLRLAAHIEREVTLDPNARPIVDEPVVKEGGDILIRVFYWALADLPLIFPHHYIYNDEGEVYPTFTDNCLVGSLLDFLEINPAEFMHLFTPTMQSPHEFGGAVLPFHAKPVHVAQNIQDLVAQRMNTMHYQNTRKNIN